MTHEVEAVGEVTRAGSRDRLDLRIGHRGRKVADAHGMAVELSAHLEVEAVTAIVLALVGDDPSGLLLGIAVAHQDPFLNLGVAAVATLGTIVPARVSGGMKKGDGIAT